MRIRLPPSIIASIESHLRPDFHPVRSLSPALQSGTDARSKTESSRLRPLRPISSAEPTHTDSTYQVRAVGPLSDEKQYNGNERLGSSSRSGSSTQRATQPSRSPSTSYNYEIDTLHLDVPHLLRNSPKSQSHLDTAHQYLTKQRFDPASPVSRLRRQITYSKMISAFLSHPQGLDAIHTFLDRSLQEGIPISIPTLTAILHSVSSSPDLNERMKVVHGILPLLPEQLDIPLLDVLLRTVIRDTSPEPEMVEKMIVDCLKLDHRGSRDRWPLEVWDLLLSAYAQRRDLRGAIKVLGELKDTVRPSFGTTTTSALASSSNAGILSQKDKQAICKAYTTVLKAYRNHRSYLQSNGQTRRSRSCVAQSALIPRQLAADLIELLGGERPSTGFLNAWLRIERENGEVEVAESVWKIIIGAYRDADSFGAAAGAESGQGVVADSIGVAEKHDPVSESAGVAKTREIGDSAQDGPDSESWRSLFALYDPSTSTRTPSLPPIRTSLRRLFAQNRLTPSSVSTDTPLLTAPLFNSIVRAILDGRTASSAAAATQPAATSTIMIDFPALLVVIQQMRWAGVQPDRKTIDFISASLMHHVTYNGNMLLAQQVEIGFHPRYRRAGATAGAGNKGGKISKRWKRMGLGLPDWDFVSEVIHQTRLEQYHQDLRGRAAKGNRLHLEGPQEEPLLYPEMVYLPLSMPVGRLTGQSSAGQSEPPSSMPISGARIITTGFSSDSCPNSTGERNTTLASDPSLGSKQKQPLPSLILPALVVLIERIIVSSARHRQSIGDPHKGATAANIRANPEGQASEDGTMNTANMMMRMSDQQVLRAVMLPVEEEITPRGRRNSALQEPVQST
ncbi:hypothetical protein I316_01253 [Kwoniella heveanensis BCC8398]|uniref:Uncharacterized protein n=1 Tax=Kwoniella heveanensis BCC8398 TaxID=1296120 RepID=A0A1B9H254_9TREE|nr:hypothetical protein I316_01253 [Kwoniella heveanensis BCC8398]